MVGQNSSEPEGEDDEEEMQGTARKARTARPKAMAKGRTAVRNTARRVKVPRRTGLRDMVEVEYEDEDELPCSGSSMAEGSGAALSELGQSGTAEGNNSMEGSRRPSTKVQRTGRTGPC